MKIRTIEELHDSQIGHRKMAKIIDYLTKNGYLITNIKEYNEQFKFTINNCEYQYRKEWKSSAKDFVKYLINMIEFKKELKRKGLLK